MKTENNDTWRRVTIEELLAPLPNGTVISQGWSPQCEKEPSILETDWGVLKTTAIQAGCFLDYENKKLPIHLEPRPNYEVKSGDLLITCAGPRNRCGIPCLVRKTRRRLMISGKMYRFRINEKIATPEFVEAYLLSQKAWKEIDLMKTGISDSGLNLTHSKFKKLVIPIPNVSTQKKIVSKIEELFSEVNKGIEEIKTIHQQLKVYRQAVLKSAFEGKLTNKNAKEGDRPLSWKEVALGEVIEQPKYGTSKKCDYKVTGTGVLRIPNIKDGAVDDSDIKYAEFDTQEIETYNLKEGDLLIVRSNGSVDIVGQCALITKRSEGYLYAGYLIRLRPRKASIHPSYLLHALSSSHLRNQIEGKAKSTSGVNNINSEELKSLVIPICSVEEQQQIVQEIESRLSVCDKIEETITNSLKQAEALRQSILKKAFEGKLILENSYHL